MEAPENMPLKRYDEVEILEDIFCLGGRIRAKKGNKATVQVCGEYPLSKGFYADIFITNALRPILGVHISKLKKI